MNDLGLKRSVVIAGGTGFIGSALTQALVAAGYRVTVLSRSSRAKQSNVRYLTWAPQDPESAATLLVQIMDETSFVINLAGSPIAAHKWDDDYKQEILASRVLPTRALVRAMELAEKRPVLFISASAIGYYGPQQSATPVDETAPAGSDFLAEVCVHWEKEAQKAEALGVSTVRLRIGLALGRGGGMLSKMALPFKLGVGAVAGSGQQWMSWIHIDDLVGMMLWLLGQPKISGPMNAVAPQPVSNREFSKALARILRRPLLFKLPSPFLRMVTGEMSTLFLDGQNVTPRLALGAGYQFKFSALDRALREIYIR